MATKTSGGAWFPSRAPHCSRSARVRGDVRLSSDATFTAATVLNNAPTLANPVPDQLSPEDQAWIFTVPANTFTDAEGDALRDALADGDWLALILADGEAEREAD